MLCAHVCWGAKGEWEGGRVHTAIGDVGNEPLRLGGHGAARHLQSGQQRRPVHAIGALGCQLDLQDSHTSLDTLLTLLLPSLNTLDE